jgi:hypothetical protein
MTSKSTYDNLYENLKNRFTVVNDNSECTLGEYMLMKANEGTKKSSLPVAVQDYSASKRMLQGLVAYVNEKLTIKKPPVKDKTMKAFPLRTSLASIFSALLVCTLVVTYGLLGSRDALAGEATMQVTPSAEIDTWSEDGTENEAYEVVNL